jgi:hypothetical protein
MVLIWIWSAVATPSVQVKVRAMIKPNSISEILSIGSRIRSGNLTGIPGSTIVGEPIEAPGRLVQREPELRDECGATPARDQAIGVGNGIGSAAGGSTGIAGEDEAVLLR